ncbi:MAG TPA: glycosyltransferase family 4 protein [Planctomycetota bacterium]|nr:glycosyltransferase family 4 protein [Planctomycetota bacterium]
MDIVWWHVAIHRKELIQSAIRAGYDVHVALPPGGDEKALQALGAEIHRVNLSRKGMEPFREAVSLARLAPFYRKIKPRLVHHLTLKPVLYGTLAAAAARVPAVLNAVTGLGYLFDRHGALFRTAREGVLRMLRPAFRRRNVFFLFQNEEDRSEFERRGLATPERTRVIPGSGVDIERFQPKHAPAEGMPIVVLPARLLRPKGVIEFVQAARKLHQTGVRARFLLAGRPDPGNPASISEAEIRDWMREGVVEWTGWVTDMPGLLARSHVVCLPSYREGLAMTILEAMAAGKPVVTTDVPGCRDAVTHGREGLLVPPRDPAALAEALRTLIRDPGLRERMGAAGRARAVREFSAERVCEETLALYERILEATRRAP